MLESEGDLMKPAQDHYGALSSLQVENRTYRYYRLTRLQEMGVGNVSRLPFTIKILLESLLRRVDDYLVTKDHVHALANWNAAHPDEHAEVPFLPARILLQDFTGVPVVVDLAALRQAMHRMGGDPRKINPLVPVDLVIDHSVQVDAFGTTTALEQNVELEFSRNRERYEFLHWATKAFDNFRVIPPATGIVHQVNLEYLASVVQTGAGDGDPIAYPDSLVGTDSHTTMINGLGVLGWGVGGIEAEAGMLGQPLYFVTPQVIGFRLTGRLPEGSTATDLALTVTNMLRKKGVVGKFVEFFGAGLSSITLADRATIANMAPEYGATMGFFPIDAETIKYLRATNRSAEQAALVEAYAQAQGLFRTDDTPDPLFTDTIELDLSTVVAALAGPKRPQDRVVLTEVKQTFVKAVATSVADGGFGLSHQERETRIPLVIDGRKTELEPGSLVIAAITSCTNTSNPSVMLAAGLLAKKAVEAGLTRPAHVKTSLGPGSRVVTQYLADSGTLPYLEQLGFDVVGYGCTTCIGNSGPLIPEVEEAVRAHGLTVAAVLSGNRNFEGRVHPQVRANYLASPPLVVAYALAGTIARDLATEPIGLGKDDKPIYLKDIWPSAAEVEAAIEQFVTPALFAQKYKEVLTGNDRWNALPTPEGELFAWEPSSTYIQEPPFFENIASADLRIAAIQDARVLALLGDSVTTDHISPAGAIAPGSPAGKYLLERGVSAGNFNSYGSRRGNHEVMMRGTFANVRIRNQLAPGTEGGYTTHLPSGEVMAIYDAAMRYVRDEVPTVVIAGKEYGTGSSRDWAAKGTYLLGARAVIAQSFERIHRSNLVGMGVLPIQMDAGDSWQSLGLTGHERISIDGLDDALSPHQRVQVRAVSDDGSARTFAATVRLDSPVEIDYYRNGGILQMVLRTLMKSSG
jgi:aconitate hydratase